MQKCKIAIKNNFRSGLFLYVPPNFQRRNYLSGFQFPKYHFNLKSLLTFLIKYKQLNVDKMWLIKNSKQCITLNLLKTQAILKNINSSGLFDDKFLFGKLTNRIDQLQQSNIYINWEIFKTFNKTLVSAGVLFNKGKMVDAIFVNVPHYAIFMI